MEWNMLEESKRLFPHWLDKTDDSNFTKHLKILNKQQTDIRHKLKTIEWSRLLKKPLQIHKVQTEPHKWKMEFEVDVKRLKKVNIYKNPIIVDNEVVNSLNVINGYYYEGQFYKNHSKEITNLRSNVSEEDGSYNESEINVSDKYVNLIIPIEDSFYYDLISNKYFKYSDGEFNEEYESNVVPTSLVHSESFIDNYSHYFRHILYDNNINEVVINKFVVDDENNQKYKTILNYPNSENNGKYELTLSTGNDVPRLYYNVNDDSYYVYEDDDFVEVDDDKIVWIEGDRVERVDIDNDGGYYYIFLDSKGVTSSRIPLIEREDISPIISNDRYVIEVYTWDDFHFLKGFPEIDFIDYNNNNIIDSNERTYDNLNITLEKINDRDYLTFRVHQYGIKLVEIFKDDKPIHRADFVVEKLGYTNSQINSNFAHIYNYNDNEVYYPYLKDTDSLEEVILDKDEYVWRLKLEDSDKIFDENGNWNYELMNKYDLKVTYYDSLHPNNSEYDKILRKSYVYEDSIFYHDVSLDMLGSLFNVHRYVFRQPSLDDDELIDFYSKTYPTYCNTLSEDDYHYQKRLMYYINNYNKCYFPVLELWKYFHITSELVNRKVILSEQNYSYLRTLDAEENQYINELGKNKLESFYLNDEYISEEEEKNLKKPKVKSIIDPEDYLNSIDGILVDENNNYIKDVEGNFVRTDYVYSVVEDSRTGEKTYYIEYENASRVFDWYCAELDGEDYQIKLTKSLRIVPNTKYQLRFCVKEYPNEDLNLRILYKDRNDNVIEVDEYTPTREDYNEIDEYNELVYTDYEKEWGISCEYICTNFVTLDVAQNIELILESKDNFKISDVTLQRVTINHFDSEYMRTSTDYNSCVYDLYADYTKIPSNIRYNNLNIFNEILNRSLPITKIGYFNFIYEEDNISNEMILDTETNIYVGNLLDFDVLEQEDNAIVDTVHNGVYEHTYQFNKYVQKGDYEIIIKPFVNNENNIINDLKLDINMILFNKDNTAVERTITIEDISEYLVIEDSGRYFKIPFENKSENTLDIRLYRENSFEFKNFKLIRKTPLTIGELTS